MVRTSPTIALVVAALFVSAFIATGCSADSATTSATSTSDSGAGEGQGQGSASDPAQPDRTAEVKGVVVSVNGTTVTVDRYIKDPSEELTDEEKAAKKAARAELTQEERQALKEAENAALETERVTVTVPVGVPITQMVLTGDTSTAQASTLAAIKVGSEVTIWTLNGLTEGGIAEYVKISSTK